MTIIAETEQAKQELLNRLKEGKLDGIESILDKILPGNALTVSFNDKLDPKVVDNFYTVAIKYYENKKQCGHIVTLCEYFQKTHRAKYQLELEDAQ